MAILSTPMRLVALFCGCVAALEDTSALLQADFATVHQHREAQAQADMAVHLTRADADSWPEFTGDIWDAVKDSAKEVTGELGDISQILDGGFDGVKSLIFNKSMETAAIVFAKSLANALVTVDNATKKLRSRTTAQKAEILSRINETSVTDLMNATMQKALSNFGKVRDLLGVAGSMIGSSFERAGQPGLASVFKQIYDAGLMTVDSYVASIKNATYDLAQLQEWQNQTAEAAMPVIQTSLLNADANFRAAAMTVPQTAAYLTDAFRVSLDSTLDALPEATDRVQAAFGEVMGNVSDIVFQLRSSSRELTTTCHSVLADTARTYNIALPAWNMTKIPLPTYAPFTPSSPSPASPSFPWSGIFSGSARTAQFSLLSLVALLAFVQ